MAAPPGLVYETALGPRITGRPSSAGPSFLDTPADGPALARRMALAARVDAIEARPPGRDTLNLAGQLVRDLQAEPAWSGTALLASRASAAGQSSYQLVQRADAARAQSAANLARDEAAAEESQDSADQTAALSAVTGAAGSAVRAVTRAVLPLGELPGAAGREAGKAVTDWLDSAAPWLVIGGVVVVGLVVVVVVTR